MPNTPPEPDGPALSRRHLLGLAGAGATGLAVGGVGGYVTGRARPAAPVGSANNVIGQTYSPFGPHQPGIITPVPAASSLVAFTLLPDTDRVALGRLMRLWTGDIVALMAGKAVAGDTTPEMAQRAVSLTVTVGFGPQIFARAGIPVPPGLADIPAMRHDALRDDFSGGDLLVLVAADDPTTVAYARSKLVRDALPFAPVRWVQDGSWRGIDSEGRAITGRNLFGQVDGTGNPTGAPLDRTVWMTGEHAGATTLAIRRIEMDIPVWDTLNRERQEKVIGRRLSNGAPLTGTHEFDALDLAALDPETAEPVIALDAHARLSHPSQHDGKQILRRGLNYTYFSDGKASSGLLFLAFQASIPDQFTPIQQTLDAHDALNEWTTAIGSAVFYIPRGLEEGGWLGQSLLR